MKSPLPIIILLFIFSCNNKTESKLPLPITLLIIPEDYDSTYSITWTDTLGQSKNYSVIERPFELWTEVRAVDTTVGYYHGLSMPRNFAYFTTKDSIITVFFAIGPNGFSEKLTEEMFEQHKDPVQFEPIEINIKKEIRKELKFTLIEN